MTDGTAGVLGGGPGGGAGGMPTEAAAGVAELGAGASVSIAVAESLSTTSAYEDLGAHNRPIRRICWRSKKKT